MHSSWKSRGGGSLGFLANSFEGGTWGCEKISGGGGGRFYCIFMWKFSKIFIGGTWGAPLLPPVCIYELINLRNLTGVLSKWEQVLRSTWLSSTIQKWLTSTTRRSCFWEKIFFLLNLTPNLTCPNLTCPNLT